ncbi:hypothetical protein ANOM_010121 [Aspergillus nomiae NRRL 13137]|uniref:Calcium uniporter protein n=1 Tax=Aspergillus nomiae NRRL (strain ATCC 15546 / NRRL 13137 / CBS 260.88 / M93) TaxID=1509407 RepID=A0A0L1ISW1_ASPN3|nr:uncharacterized protein ANOM_010121 [Aspergillus nomiae NRRL 13137]KNG82666.1 hypothetical protein ANOM_010121 [Aspergillus nomiae NRRL 13137]
MRAAVRRVSAFGAMARRPIGVPGTRLYVNSPVAGQSRVACGVLAGRQGQGALRCGLPVSMQVRRFAHFDAIQEDKQETRDELERLEIREKDRQRSAESEDGEQGSKLANAMSKGKLLTTPSRLFKVLIPLPTASHNSKHDDIEPIAILIHPQQPLSYLERLIQDEIPPVSIDGAKPRPPAVSFIALQMDDNPVIPKKSMYETTDTEVHRLGEIGAGHEARQRRRRPDEEDDTYSYLRRGEPGKSNREERFVRWSQSTEVGDFVRDASRAREFIVSIEGGPAGLRQIHVTVPSFDQRTHFLRMRLRKISGRIQSIAEIKHECDALAHRGAQRVATDLGWDTMEPVTYLASLSTLMGGYLWFLYHNREISYKSALDFTINARQKKLYEREGVDLHEWESLIDEGNLLRKEIKTIAAEYDVVWDEKKDERDERVTEALRKERMQKNGSNRTKESEDDD